MRNKTSREQFRIKYVVSAHSRKLMLYLAPLIVLDVKPKNLVQGKPKKVDTGSDTLDGPGCTFRFLKAIKFFPKIFIHHSFACIFSTL